jgi:hypothetical protein
MTDGLTRKGLAEAAAQAEKLSQDRRLRGAVAGLFKGDERAVETALTAPREFLAGAGVNLLDYLEVVIFRGRHEISPVFGKFGPDFEFFSIRQFDCHTYWLPKVDEEGKIVGYEEQEFCWGFEITPKFLPGGPIS